jgi:hypothetical protein
MKNILKYTGNGISKEQAIFFTNAVTQNEFMMLELAYLRSKSMYVKNKYVTETSNGFDYDIFQTNSGMVFFKKPAKKAEEKELILS